jgi:hypothetical protein
MPDKHWPFVSRPALTALRLILRLLSVCLQLALGPKTSTLTITTHTHLVPGQQQPWVWTLLT